MIAANGGKGSVASTASAALAIWSAAAEVTVSEITIANSSERPPVSRRTVRGVTPARWATIRIRVPS